MASSEEQLGRALAACVSDMDQVLHAEIQQLASEFSQRLAVRFAEHIAQSCGHLHNENLHLRRMLNGNAGNVSALDMAPPIKLQSDESTSDISVGSSDPLHYANDLGMERQKSEAKLTQFGIPQLSFLNLTNEVSQKDSGGLHDSVESNAVQDIAANDEGEPSGSSSPPTTVIGDHECGHGDDDIAEQDRTRSRNSVSSMLWAKPSRRQTKDLLIQPGCRTYLAMFVLSPMFEGFFNFIIMVNCVTMGLEAEQTSKGPINDGFEAFLFGTEHLLTALFLIELVLRMIVFGVRAFIPWMASEKQAPDSWWNFMDAFLVLITGVLFSWIIPFVAWCFGFDAESGVFRTLSVLRAIRLLRLVRLIRRVPQFREAWLLLRGLTESMRTLFWTCTVIMFVTYIFAVFGMVLITKEIYERRNQATDSERYAALTDLLQYVGGLDLLMYTLIQLLTLDSWNGIVRELLKELPWCWMYFYAYIAVSVFVLMNLVTAIIVENAVKNSNEDMDQAIKAKEKEKRKELRTLEDLFKEMDTDGSGTLNWEEFKEAFDDPLMVKKWRLLDFEPDECRELFGLLDDGDGEIETGEFFEGLAKMKGTAQSKDIFRLQKCVDIMMDSGEKSGTKSEAKRSTSELPSAPSPAPSCQRGKVELTTETPPDPEKDRLLEFQMCEREQDTRLAENAFLFHAVQRYLKDLVEGRLTNGYAMPKPNGCCSGGGILELGQTMCSSCKSPYVPASASQNPGRNLRI